MEPTKKVNTGIKGMYPRQDPSINTFKCPYHTRKPEEKDPHHHDPLNYQRQKIYNNILEVVGNTPVVRLNTIPKEDNVKCQMFVKCEFLNPGGSLKDRIGKRMVEEAERSGLLKNGDTLIEATSGNTGIGLSLTAAVKGYDMHITMPEKMSNEKVDVLKCLGAKIHKTPTEANFDDDDSHIATAIKLRDNMSNAHILDQYVNPGNALAHYDGTGSELCHQFDGQLDYVFVGTGTGGTITGIGRKIKEAMPNCKVIGVDPHGSILAMPQSLNTVTGNVLMEGIGYDFVPRTIDRNVIHDWQKINDQTALPMARRLIGSEGLLCGGTSGGTVGGAIEYLKKNGLDQNENLKVCCIAGDNIRNYLTKLVSQQYMVEKGLQDFETIVEPTHPLKGKSLDALNLKVVPQLTEKSTISEAIAIFQQGFTCIPVFQNGESYPSRGLLEGKFMECIVNKSLKGTDSVSKTWTQEFSVAQYDKMDQALLQRFLERREAVLLVKTVEGKTVVHQATPKDIIHLVVAN